MRALWLVAILGITPCGALAQEQDVAATLINPWYYCVGRAAGRQSDKFQNPELAVERGFLACQTEEMAIRSFGELLDVTPSQMNAIISKHRLELKRSIVAKILEMKAPPKRGQ